MKSISKIIRYSLFALAIVLVSCSAEDGQDGLPGKDGINGVDGTDGTPGAPGQDGVGAIDLGWGLVQSNDRTEEQDAIVFGFDFASAVTAEQLESFGIFSYVRSPAAPDPKFALPANLIFGDEMNPVPHNISFLGIDGTQVLFIIEREDGAPIAVDAVIPDLELKIILVPSTVPAAKRALALEKMLD